MQILASTDPALVGVLATLVTALVGSLGWLVKAMSDRIDKKDLELAESRSTVTLALNESSSLIKQVLEYLDRVSVPKKRV